jgi:hypothetical protein
LLNFTGKLQVRRNDVLFLKRASINWTLTTVAPIFELSQSIVKCTTTDFHPLKEHLFLSDVWIDSIAVGECQHSNIVAGLLMGCEKINVKRRGVEPLLLTAFHPTVKPGVAIAYGSIHPRWL